MKVAGEQRIVFGTGVDLTNMSTCGITMEREKDGATKSWTYPDVAVDSLDPTLGNLKRDLVVTDFPAGSGGNWRVSGYVVISSKRYPLATAVLPVEEEYE